MPMLPVILLLAATYALLTYVVLPWFEKKWRESSRFATVGRAGMLAAIRTAQAFAKLALIVFVAAFVILGILSIVAPLTGASALAAMHSKLGWLLTAVRDLKASIGNVVLIIALAGLAYLAWRVRARGLRSMLAEERDRQILDLQTKRQAEQLPELAPTPEMEESLKRYAELDAVAKGNPTAEGYTTEQIQAAIAIEQHALVARYHALDIERRVDLTAIPLADPKPDGWLGKLRLMLFSRGATEGLGWVSKNLGRVATILACLLMIGVSAPALARFGIQPTLARLTDLQVTRSERDALASLRDIAREASEEEGAAAATAEDSQAYRAAAQHFVNAIARSRAWTDWSTRLLPERAELVPVSHGADIIEEAAIRQKILEVHAENLRASFPRSAARPVVHNLGGVSDGSRRLYTDRLGDVRPASVRREYAAAVNQTEKWIAARAKASPDFKAWLMDGIAKFRQPATAWDVTGRLLGEGLSRSIAEALPDPQGSDPFRGQIGRSGRSGLQSAGERLVQLSLNDFLKAHANKTAYASAIGRVEAGAAANWPFRHGEAIAIRDMANRITLDRSRIGLAMNDSAPGLVSNPTRAERAAARQAVEAIVRSAPTAEEMAKIRGRVEGTLGDFEYHFPAQVRSATQAAEASGLLELAEAANTDLPPFDRPERRARASRSYPMMRASFRAGGVVIGSDPIHREPLDFQRLHWSREGSRLRLAVIDSGGRRLEVGSFGGAMIQQALAYAADGRPMTVTMTESPLTPSILRVHVHPALLDTKLGCRLIELDRFTDEATGDWAERERWQRAVQLQLGLYQAVVEGSLSKVLAGEDQMTLAGAFTDAFALLDNVDDSRQSVFAAYPERFDLGLVRELKQCSTDPSTFLSCGGGYSVNNQSYNAPETWAVWSGVRERDFDLRRASFASALKASTSPLPLRFMMQVAFKDEEVDQTICETGECEAQSEPGWEFPLIARELDRRVRDHVDRSAADSAILAEAAEFTVLQRLFRAALRGQLGPRFERAGLIRMMRDAAALEPIGYAPTLQWSMPRFSAGVLAAALDADPERTARLYETPSEAEASRAYLRALLAPGSGARFAGDAQCR